MTGRMASPHTFDPCSVATVLADPTVVIDATTTVVWANPAAERLFGLPLETVIGMSGLDLVHPEDLHLAASATVSMSAKDVGTLIEVRMRTADGWRLLEMIGGRSGDHIVLSLRDLTERRRWEVANDDSARLRSILQNAASLMLLVDPDGTVTETSGSLTRLLGHDQEWLEMQPLHRLVAADDHPRLDALLTAIVRGDPTAAGRRHSIVLDLCQADGRCAPFALTVVDLLDDPTVAALVVTGHDIAELMTVEADLRQANSMLSATLDSTADGIVAVDLAGRITGVNDRISELLHLGAQELRATCHLRLLDHIASQLRDPIGHVRRVQDLISDPSVITRDNLDFTDGRVIERRSRPQMVDGQVVGRVWSYRDVTSEQHLARELAHQALHDPLTGLPNRALFRDRVEQTLARLTRVDSHLAVLFVDLDNFKTVNDSLGHAAGDELLIEIARRIERCVRAGDTVARLGGDEFAVLVDGFEHDDLACDVAQRIVESLQVPFTVHGREVIPTASIGLANAVLGTGAEELLRNADLAMYTAKSGGRNCVRSYAPEMHRAALERLELETELRRAIERREFVVHYQPIVDLGSGVIRGFEALVRWRHPDRGLIHPAEFIGVAEEGDHLIDGIADQVLEDSCAQLAAWAADGETRPLSVAVNIAPGQLLDPGFAGRIERALADHGLAPSCLTLELTERALMRDPDTVAVRLQRLHRAGIRISVDDFGTGYSSLAYLQRFAIDVIKIDRSFVAETLTRPDLNLAGAIVRIADTLGLVTVAEGIESEAQVVALQAMGCTYGQGYHLGVPMSGADATALLDRTRGGYSTTAS